MTPTPNDANRKFHLGVTDVFIEDASLVNDGAWPEKIGNEIGRNLNPYDAIADFVLYDGERSSHLDNPEHSVTYVNEQLITSGMQYDKLAVAGLRLNSAKEWSSFSSFSAYIKKGIKVERFQNNIKIYGNPNLKLNKNYVIKNYFKDHRIFMMSTIAALTCGGKWKIHNKESINTSFPLFLKIIKELNKKVL